MTSDRGRRSALPVGRWLVALAVVAGELGWATSVRAADQKEVLVLYATRRDSQIAIVGERELPRLLAEQLREGVDYYSEYIDQGRFPDPVYQAALGQFLGLKYSGRRFDVIIAMHDLALEFVSRHRDELFPGTPVVFFASSPATQRIVNSTGVVGPQDFGGSLALALALQPDLEHVFVVAGAGSGDTSYDTLARAQFRRFESRLAVTYLTGLPTQDLEARLATLPAHSIVYYLVVDRDGAGRIFHPLAYLDRVTAVANAPTYCWVDSAMDHGIVGGSLKSHTLQTEAIAGLALRVLRGERADSIPTTSPNLNVAQVDWRQLRRWGISESRVPAGTLVRFREPSVWERYRIYILAAAAILLAQSGLITGLLIQRTRRRRVEARLRSHEAELQASYERLRDLGARLLNAQESERSRIARELHDDISQQVALLEIDLELLGGAVQAEGGQLADEALHRARSIARSVHDLSHRLHPAKLRLIGLVAGLDGLRHELSRGDIAITFVHDGVPPALSPDLTLCLFRVVQEALQNAQKYSGARRVAVNLRGSPDGLALTITDDGAGFDVGAAWGKGLGLISMAERLEAIGGSLEIHSTPGTGTRLEVKVPARLVESAEPVAI